MTSEPQDLASRAPALSDESARGTADLIVHLSGLEWEALRREVTRTDLDLQDRFLSLVFLGLLDLSGLDTLDTVLQSTSGVPLDPYRETLRRGCRALVDGRGDDAIQAALDAQQAQPFHTMLPLIVGRAQLSLGRLAEAFENLYRVCQTVTSDALLRITTLKCLEHMDTRTYSESLARGVREYMQDPRLESAAVTRIACSLVFHKYQLDLESPAPRSLEAMAQDDLLVQTLAQVPLSHPGVELWLLEVRREVLENCLRLGRIPPEVDPLVHALVRQAIQNEHVFLISGEERRGLESLVEGLTAALSAGAGDDAEMVAPFLLLSMYVDPWTSPLRRPLLDRPLETWPQPIQPLVHALIHRRALELEAAASIESLTPIEDPTSVEVRSMYEEHPYPRWESVSRIPSSRTYLEAFARRFPERPLPEVEGRPHMLIAGSGTGRHPIGLALAHPELDVTCVDLSQASLGYAQLKAEELGVSQLEFYQADLLRLQDWEARFPIIECGGVLHHLRSPSAGLGVLRTLMSEHGILKLALYSGRAREEITAYRAQGDSGPISDDELRTRRHALLRADLGGPEFLRAPDFYRTSGCRDLLFHVQEHTMNIPEIADLLDEHRLSFCGFDFRDIVAPAAFARRFPGRSFDDLDAWHAFEAENPETFASMYAFYAQAV